MRSAAAGARRGCSEADRTRGSEEDGRRSGAGRDRSKQATITREESATLACARYRFLEHVKMADVAAPGPGDPPRRPLAAWVVHEQKAWVREQGVDPSQWGHVTGDHSLRGGQLDASLVPPPGNPEHSAASASWSHFNARQQSAATPVTAVRASVCGYAKDGKTRVFCAGPSRPPSRCVVRSSIAATAAGARRG